MKKTKHSNRKAFFPFLFFLGFFLALHQPASAQFIPGTIYGKVTIGADPTQVTGDLVLKSTGELYLGGSGNRTHRLELNGNYQGESGSKLYVSITENSNTSGHGYVSVSGTATGSTRLIPDVLLSGWDGTAIDLAEAAETGSGADAFTMDETTAVTSGKKAVLLSRVESGKRIWYITTPGVALNLKVFLQGPLKITGVMTNYLQEPVTGESVLPGGPVLPQTNPYGISGTYAFDGTANGPAGAVTDWIRVDVCRLDESGKTINVSQSKALLLKTNGNVVDVNGQPALFNEETGKVRLMIRHRNHLMVLSNEIDLQGSGVAYDFTDAASKAYGSVMTEKGTGLWCLWAGDLNADRIIESTDMGIQKQSFRQGESGSYLITDVTMDGSVESSDDGVIQSNFKKGVPAPFSTYTIIYQ